MMCHRRWNLWLLTVTIGFWVICLNGDKTIAIGRFTKSNETTTATNNVNKMDNGTNSQGALHHSTLSSSAKTPVGYAAEWEYEGGGQVGTEESDDPFPTEQFSAAASSAIPSERVGPGTWLNANGSWWMFGGQGPTTSSPLTHSSRNNNNNQTKSSSIQFLSDLWVYDSNLAQHSSKPLEEGEAGVGWQRVYSPRSDSQSPISSYPDSIAFPVLCGSESSGHLAVFGGATNPRADSRANNSPFVEDNIVWLYDIPRNSHPTNRPTTTTTTTTTYKSKIERTTGDGDLEWTYQEPWNGTEGLWTSYICCDACLPDGNTTLEFCPQFSGDPILWCATDSLMALELSSPPQPTAMPTTTTRKTQRPLPSTSTVTPKTTRSTMEPGRSEKSPLNIGHSLASLPTNNGDAGMSELNGSGGNRSYNVSSKMHLRNDSIDERETVVVKVRDGNADKWNKGEQMNYGTESGWRIVNWWKFDLGSTEWIKMPEVNISGETAALMSAGGYRTVDDGHFVYILCPPSPTTIIASSSSWGKSSSSRQTTLSRSVLLFDPGTVSIRLLATISLNNAFRDKKVWQLGRSVFHALRSDNHTVIFLAYHKLLDLWIHDHQSNAVYSVENVWKGSSLHIFQRTNSFYKLTISLPCSFQKGNGGGGGGDKERNRNNISFYMVNPRTKLFTFDDPQPAARFHITIVTDKSVFLPSRDASFLISANLAPTPHSGNGTLTRTVSGNSTKEIENVKSNNRKAQTTMANATNATDGIFTTTRRPMANMKYGKAGFKITAAKILQKERLAIAIGKLLAGNSNSSLSLRGGREDGLERTTGVELPIGIPSLDSPSVSVNLTTSGKTSGVSVSVVEISAEERASLSPTAEWKTRLSWRSKSNLSRNNSLNENNNSGLKSMRMGSSVPETRKTAPPSEKNFSKKRILGIKSTFAAGSILPKVNGKVSQIGTATSSLPLNNEKTKSKWITNSAMNTSTFATKSLMTEVMAKAIELRDHMDSDRISPQHSNSSLQNSSPTPQPQNTNVSVQITVETNTENSTTTIVTTLSTDARSVEVLTTNRPEKRPAQHPTTSSSTHEIDEFYLSREPVSSGPNEERTWNLSNHGNRKGFEDTVVHADNSKSIAVDEGRTEGEENDTGTSTWSTSANLIEDWTTQRRDEEIMENEAETGQSPLTYGSSEIMIDSRDDIRPIGQDPVSSSDSSYSSMLFFSISLTIFASFGVVLFVRRCVKCPPRQSVLLKEPPPIQYSVIPDELSFRTPVV